MGKDELEITNYKSPPNYVIPSERSEIEESVIPIENGSFDSLSTTLEVAQDDNCDRETPWVSPQAA